MRLPRRTLIPLLSSVLLRCSVVERVPEPGKLVEVGGFTGQELEYVLDLLRRHGVTGADYGLSMGYYVYVPGEQAGYADRLLLLDSELHHWQYSSAWTRDRSGFGPFDPGALERARELLIEHRLAFTVLGTEIVVMRDDWDEAGRLLDQAGVRPVDDEPAGPRRPPRGAPGRAAGAMLPGSSHSVRSKSP